jgi:hypothetical protein
MPSATSADKPSAAVRPLNPSFVVGSVGAWAFVALYFATTHGHLDAWNDAIGPDFANFWAASRLVLQHRTIDVFDPPRFLEALRAMFDRALPLHFWSYPPIALLFVAPLGLVGYFLAYALWLVAGLVALAVAARAFLRVRRDVVLLLLSPAAAMNLVLGQNGFLTGAMLLGGAALMDRRPIAAGALFGLLSFKPQLGVLVPVAVLAQRRWCLFSSAVLTAIVLTALSVAIYGLEAWGAFFHLTIPMQTLMMSAGTGPFQWGTPSSFMAGRLLGLPLQVAVSLQAAFAMLGAWLVWRAYGRPGHPSIRAAMLMVATFLATPQSFNYDMIPVAAAALVLSRGPSTLGDRLLCGVAWLMPFAVIVLNAAGFPVAPLALLLVAWRLDRLQGSEARARADDA